MAYNAFIWGKLCFHLQMIDECLNGAFGIAFRMRPSFRTQAFVAIQEAFVRSTVCETSSTDSQILHQTQIFHLMKFGSLK